MKKIGSYIAGIVLPLAFALPANTQNFDRSSLDSLFNSGMSKEISRAYESTAIEASEIPEPSPLSKSENHILKFCPGARVDQGIFAVGYDYFDEKTREANVYVYDATHVDYKYPKVKASIPARVMFKSQDEPLTVTYELSIEKMYKPNNANAPKNCIDLKVRRTEDRMQNFGDFLPGKN